MNNHLSFILLPFLLCVFSIELFAAKEVGPFRVSVADKNIKILKDKKSIAVVKDIRLNFESWDKLEEIESNDPNIKKVKIYYDNSVSAQEIETYYDHEVILEISHSDAGLRFQIKDDWFRHVNIFMDDLGGQMYGVKQTLEPYAQKSPNLRGLIQDVNAIGEQERFRSNYATAVSPMFFNTKGYVSFFDTFAEGRYHFSINGQTELYHASRIVDWYIFDAPTLDSALVHYFDVIGSPKLVPAWSTGPIIWRDDHKRGKKDIRDDTKKFNELKMPFTGMFIDRPYSDGAHSWSKMNFNELFSNPEVWIKELREENNVKLMTWVASATWADHDFPGRLAGNRGYFDLTNPDAVAKYKKRLTENQYAYGVQGHKMDRADEQFPVDEKWADKTVTAERRSKYIWLYAKYTDEALRESWGDDQFNFARAAVHGTQQHLSAIWGGDVMTNWGGLENNIANAVRASYQGFPNWGSDVGGYIGKTGRISEDLYLRWMQFGLWTGFFEIKIDAGGGRGLDRPPWVYPESFQALYREVLEERMALMPYIHSLLNTAHQTGTLMKPLAGLYPTDKNTYEIWDQYMFGPALLVAPVYNTETTRKLYLPRGVWFDYYSGEKYKGGKWLDVKTSKSHVPVFVKANTPYIKGDIYQGNDITWKTNDNSIEVHVFWDRKKPNSDSFTFVDGNNDNQKTVIDMTSTKKDLNFNLNGLPYKGKIVVHEGAKLHEQPFEADTKGQVNIPL